MFETLTRGLFLISGSLIDSGLNQLNKWKEYVTKFNLVKNNWELW